MSLTNIEQKVKGGEESICKTCAHNKVCWYMDNQPCIVCSQYAAQERRGRWIPDSNKHAFSEECSVCGEGVLWDDGRLHQYNYCPHCGAKMESGTALSEAEPLAGCADDADLEHMTRFAMQQAVNRK